MSLSKILLGRGSVSDETLDSEVVSIAWHEDHWCCPCLDDQGRKSYSCQNAPSMRAPKRPVCAEREGRDPQPPNKKRRICFENLEDVVREIVQTLSEDLASSEAREASDEAREASDEAREGPNEPNEVGEEGREQPEEVVDGGQSENSADDHKFPDKNF